MRIAGVMLIAGLLCGAAQAQVKVEVAHDAIRAEGLRPDGGAVLMGLGKGRSQGMGALLRCLRTAQVDDRGGAVVFEPCGFQGKVASPIPDYSAWVVVDVATGEMAAASPAGPMKVEPMMGVEATQMSTPGRYAAVLVPGQAHEVLVVRPGVGAWDATIIDGLTGDEDGQADGKVLLAVTTMRRASRSHPELHSFATGDVFIIIDRQYFAVAMARLGGGR